MAIDLAWGQGDGAAWLLSEVYGRAEEIWLSGKKEGSIMDLFYRSPEL